MTTDQQRTAEAYALADDENLQLLMAWRLVKQRAETGGFNGLLSTDLTTARLALEGMLEQGQRLLAIASSRTPQRQGD